MKCQKCGKFSATTHIHTVINGKTADMHLCGYCASGKGFDRLGHFGLMNMLASVFNDETLNPKSESEPCCKICGATFATIASTGKVGCANCYTTFYRQLYPTLKRIHGVTHHCGKIPRSAAPRLSAASKIDDLKKQLKSAVEVENFELAAKLRDQINALKEGE